MKRLVLAVLLLAVARSAAAVEISTDSFWQTCAGKDSNRDICMLLTAALDEGLKHGATLALVNEHGGAEDFASTLYGYCPLTATEAGIERKYDGFVKFLQQKKSSNSLPSPTISLVYHAYLAQSFPSNGCAQ